MEDNKNTNQSSVYIIVYIIVLYLLFYGLVSFLIIFSPFSTLLISLKTLMDYIMAIVSILFIIISLTNFSSVMNPNKSRYRTRNTINIEPHRESKLLNDLLINPYKENKLLSTFVIIPYYEPPSNIHPAVAGFLIDRKIGKNEFFAILFNSIIKGYVAIDERIDESGKYKYFLIKNKGWVNYDLCDRAVIDNVFYYNDKFNDEIPFSSIKIELNGLSIFIDNKLIELKYFDDPYYYTDGFIRWLEDIGENKEEWINEKRLAAIKDREKMMKEKERKSKIIKEYCKIYERDPVEELKQGYTYDTMNYTSLGAEERAKWLGFKDYLQTAERFRMDVEKVETFSEYLPYAVALGVETEWAKRFEDMDINRVEWFRSQKSESIRRHDSQKVYFKHLIDFLGQIRTIQ